MKLPLESDCSVLIFTRQSKLNNIFLTFLSFNPVDIWTTSKTSLLSRSAILSSPRVSFTASTPWTSPHSSTLEHWMWLTPWLNKYSVHILMSIFWITLNIWTWPTTVCSTWDRVWTNWTNWKVWTYLTIFWQSSSDLTTSRQGLDREELQDSPIVPEKTIRGDV